MAVGLHHARIYSGSYHVKVKVSFKDFFNLESLGEIGSEFLFHFRYHTTILSLLFIHALTGNVITALYMYLLIMQDNDVEPNPGDPTLSIFHLNIRSLRNKISYLSDLTEEYDIICVSETHLDENVNTTDLLIDGFYPNPFRKDRNAHGGGLMVYVSDKLFVKRQPHLEVNGTEMIWLQLKLSHQTFLICCVYRPPNSPQIFWDNLHASLENAVDQNQQIVVLGDLNVDLGSVTQHRLIDIMNDIGLRNCIDTPTRFGPVRNTILDLILIRECSILNSEVIDVDRTISDHNGVLINLKTDSGFKTAYKREVWDYRNCDFTKFNQDINNADWETMAEINDVEETCDFFTTTYLNLAEDNIPKKKVTIRPNDKPWFNSELRKEIRKRDRLRKRALKSNSLAIYENYRKQRNHVNNLKKTAKQSYFIELHGLIDDYSSNNNQDFWKLARKLTKSCKSISIPPLLNQTNGNIATNDFEKATLLNQYFASISTINDNNDDAPQCPIRTENILDNIVITESEIIDVINSLKPNKASGHDEISHRMLKGTATSISKPLLILFKKSLNAGIYPSSWKQARVMPIFKKGDPNLPSNYRPISLLSTVGKLFERIIHKHMYNFFLDNKLFYKYQSGFLSNNSTIYQLLEIYHSIVLNMEDKKNTCFIFCDVSKAFDRVWHKGLLEKLKAYGICGPLLTFFE